MGILVKGTNNGVETIKRVQISAYRKFFWRKFLRNRLSEGPACANDGRRRGISLNEWFTRHKTRKIEWGEVPYNGMGKEVRRGGVKESRLANVAVPSLSKIPQPRIGCMRTREIWTCANPAPPLVPTIIGSVFVVRRKLFQFAFFGGSGGEPLLG